MSWTEPKTNWLQTDFFNIEDYNRIINNLKCLKELAEALYGKLETPDLGTEFTYTDIPYAEKFNAIEEFVDSVNRNTYPFDIGDTKTFYPNRPTIDFVELNRIENACLLLYNTMTVQRNSQNKLAFVLGAERGIRV